MENGKIYEGGLMYTTTQHNFRLTEMITERIFGIIALYFLLYTMHTLFRVYIGDLELPLSKFRKDFMTIICSLPFLKFKMPKFVERQPGDTTRNKESFPGH